MKSKKGHCSKCGKKANPLYMCDRDLTDSVYCKKCFVKLPCLGKHPEDCVTMVFGEK